MSPKLLAAAWEEFRRLQVPADATAVDVLLVRRAFYGGAYTHHTLQRAITEMAPADAAMQTDQLSGELYVFAATVHTELEGKV